MSIKIDLGEDKNLLPPDFSGATGKQKATSSILIDDLARNEGEALREARQIVWDNWINSDPLLIAHTSESGQTHLFYISEALEKKTVLLHIWDYSLLPCIREIRYMNEWNHRYGSAGLMIVGIHSPMFLFGKEKTNVFRAVRDLEIQYPVVIDNDFQIWKSLENRYWPRRLLISAHGQFIDDIAGEGEYKAFEQKIQTCLREVSPGLACPPLIQWAIPLDRQGYEIFLGTKYKPPIGNSQDFLIEGKEISFKDQAIEEHRVGYLYFDGPWLRTAESMYTLIPPSETPSSVSHRLSIKFTGRSVYILARPRPRLQNDTGQFTKIKVLLNQKPVSEDHLGKDLEPHDGKSNPLPVKAPRLYQVAKNLPEGCHELTLSPDLSEGDLCEIYGLFFEQISHD